jgi:hypothetical protein
LRASHAQLRIELAACRRTAAKSPLFITHQSGLNLAA